MKKWIGLAALLSLSACHGSKHADPPGPCTNGVNTHVCANAISDASQWNSHSTVTQQPYGSATITRQIDVNYEFSSGNGQPQWRRTITIATGTDTYSMFEEGEVTSITGDQIFFKKTSSSCADVTEFLTAADDTFSLFYARNQNNLQLDTQKIEPVHAHNLGDAIGDAIGRGIGEAIRVSVEDIFTLGSARTWLTDGHGSFTGQTPSSTVNGRVGCFATFGDGFTESKMQSKFVR